GMMCEYCEQDEAGNMKWLRDEPDNAAWLEEFGGEWAIVASVTARCCGTDCTTETYVPVNNCPMCGRKLR
ncbi:MAG: hypothetical protein IJ087_00760, partial [Eggerthellaceae bacterium]|nr:hypothetical protein [Eggerthellaceae bacterium]